MTRLICAGLVVAMSGCGTPLMVYAQAHPAHLRCEGGVCFEASALTAEEVRAGVDQGKAEQAPSPRVSAPQPGLQSAVVRVADEFVRTHPGYRVDERGMVVRK